MPPLSSSVRQTDSVSFSSLTKPLPEREMIPSTKGEQTKPRRTKRRGAS